MAIKIVQTINLLSRYSTAAYAAGFNSTTMGGLVYVTPANYNGTVAFHFEAVIRVASGTGTLDLYNEAGSSVGSISVTETTLTRKRVTTTLSAANQYRFGNSGAVDVYLSRVSIVVLQNAGDALTATETQIEIGAYETGRNNTSIGGLTTPKYWYYDASKWDGTNVFSIEATYLTTNSKGAVTVKLYRDSTTPFAFDTAVATIVNAGTATAFARVRVTFTPTDGKNYLIECYTGASKYPYSIGNAKIIVTQTGTITKLETVQTILPRESNATGLRDCDIAYYSDTTEWDGVTKTFYHEIDTTVTSTAAAKLQSDPNGTPADVTNSAVTASTCRTRGGSVLTMPTGTPATIDTNITNNGGGYILHSKLIGTIVVIAVANLTVANDSHSQTLQSPVLTQKHNLTAANASHTQTLSSPALVHIINLAVADMGHSQALEAPALVQKILLVMQSATHEQTLEGPSLIQKHNLTAQECNHIQTLEAPVLTQLHILAADDLSHIQIITEPVLQENVGTVDLILTDLAQAQTIASPILTRIIDLVTANLIHNQDLEASVLTQLHELPIADAAHDQNLASPSLTQKHELAAQDMSQIQEFENILLSQAQNLFIADLAHIQALEDFALTQEHNITLGDMVQAQALESPALGQLHILAAQDVDHSQSLEAPTINTSMNLIMADLSHVQELEPPALIQIHNLAAADGYSDQTIDSPILIQEHQLALGDMAHSQAIGNIDLSQSTPLLVADLAQTQAITEAILIQLHNLALQAAFQSHNAANVILLQGCVLGVADAYHAQALSELPMGYLPEEDRILYMAVENRALTMQIEDRTLVIPEEQD